ncbi:hypothetical protein AVEN_164221-1 [Araneus ventricosus]|uniref:Uncharacterized protein n=1 Tax=Araneus ventricosus TaxID=182803 RepID=A0A4Y2LT07_ARAVE|nr:hypothetical protein AVEN_164221-1 [Araneus ventricosus]
MAIQAGKSISSCPQLVSVPLTGLERMPSSLNMALSLPTSKGFTCLTAITAVVVELARHFTMPRGVYSTVFLACKEDRQHSFEQEWLKRVAKTSSQAEKDSWSYQIHY